MRKFLNTDMEQYRKISENDANELKNAFKKAVSLTRSLFGEHAFKRFYSGTSGNASGRWELKKFNSSLYDVTMWSMARQDKNAVMRRLDAIREGLIDLMSNDKTFIDAIQLSTSSVQAVTTRFRLWDDRVQEILNKDASQPRCFSMEIKRTLFKSNPTCGLCGNAIQEIDDAAVDHIEQYWQGGQTIPENARLAHRHCNASRSRKD